MRATEPGYVYLISTAQGVHAWKSRPDFFFLQPANAHAYIRKWVSEHPADHGSLKVVQDEYADEVYGSIRAQDE